jgi:hypothetical protein
MTYPGYKKSILLGLKIAFGNISVVDILSTIQLNRGGQR